MRNRQNNFFTHQWYRCFIALALITAGYAANAQSTDTLPEVKLSAVRYPDVTVSPVPVQQLNGEALTRLNSLSVANVVNFFSGVQVKDYGGIGGLKTISVRSLGANHTGIMYDGMLLSDGQGGQIDLGKLSLDNIESIALYNSQPADILLPARSFASASILMLRSAAPKFDAAKKMHIKAGVKAGSFGFVAPALNLQYHFNPKFYNSISAEWQRADGAYPFRSYEAGGGTVKRINSDINALRLEYDAGYKINDSNVVKFKTYYYHSRRGLPGGVILYNPVSDDRLEDNNFFTQASWQNNFSAKSSLLVSAKYGSSYNFYEDPGYPNAQGKLENKFHQQEYYLSGAYQYNFTRWLSAAYTSDYFISKLKRTDDFAQGFATPTRDTWLNNISAQAKFRQVNIQGNLLYTALHDKVQNGPKGKNIDAFSPAIAASYQPYRAVPLSIRFFYKDIFRVPTFNDLYYTNVGNTALRPEYARQYNAGITYKYTGKGFLIAAVITTDAYYNKVTDKILAVPRGQNLFQWTMLNIGKVQIKGLDAAVQLYAKQISGVSLSARLAYTFQQALDVSDQNSALYKTQLPYTPEHSGSISVNAGYSKFNFAYNVLLSGYRYIIGEPLPGNLVKEWATQDVSVGYTTNDNKGNKYRLLLELNNIFNKQYEVIKYYPMPRFNYRAGLIAEF